ncbi:MAG: hypothetical protein ACI8WT_000513 [Clostridium sp.]|jgi:hypothetical protein
MEMTVTGRALGETLIEHRRRKLVSTNQISEN